LHSLVDKGNSVIVIEHNLDVVKTADWVIDMGPEGGSGGGLVVAEGTPEFVAGVEGSHTGTFLRPVLAGRSMPAPARARARSSAKTAGSARPATAKRTVATAARATSRS
jgi:excinuclease ABC subunit A